MTCFQKAAYKTSGTAMNRDCEDVVTICAKADCASTQERAKAAQGGAKGKLGKQLDAQRSQTQAGTLAANARDNVAAREADAAAQTRSYN